MRFQTEPDFKHGTPSSTGILLVNLGTPQAPTASAVRRYLKEFLSDPRVVEIPPAAWWPILNFFILPFRPARSAKKYASVWSEHGSPLKVHTEAQTHGLAELLAARGHRVEVAYAMRYGSPAIAHTLDQLKARGCQRILVLPAYPQYAGSTTASVWDAVFAHYGQVRNIPELRLLRSYHDHPAYIDALAASVRRYWAQHGQGERLLMSFHGIPKRSLELGDPYHCECHKTGRLLGEALGLEADRMVVSFQSRFGRAQWLQPYTAPTVKKLAREGVKRLDVICPGFSADCLETLEEINMEVRADFLTAGGQAFHYIPALNASQAWLAGLAQLCEEQMQGWPTRLAADTRELALQQERATGMGAKA
jgi:ferrochelatase